MGLIQRELYPDAPQTVAERPWHVLAVRGRYERRAYEDLTAKGITALLPSYKSRRRWSDRYKTIELPLFPGYVFVSVERTRRRDALRCTGVHEMIGFGGEPAAVDPTELAALKSAAESGLSVAPHPYLKVGQKARVHDGPLTGMEGILVKVSDPSRSPADRLVISVSLLQRSVAVELRHGWVLPAGPV